jgi:Zn-dependent peptidase ImmA (M78 family)
MRRSERPHHAANRLLKTLGVTRAPVDVKWVAEALDVRVIEVNQPGWAGAITSTNNTATIWVNAADAPVRKRFTIAHELGHLFLHPAGQEFRDATFTGGPKESEANWFAADLLMPLWMLDSYASSIGADAEELARMFQVSSHAMGIQLAKLNGNAVRW